MILFKVLRVILFPAAKLFFFLKQQGRDNIPETGSVIIASNHLHLFDPILHAFCTGRVYRTMAKAELFRFKPFGALLRSLGGFPVQRGRADKGAVGTAEQILADGNALLIFPEGTRSKTGEMGMFKAGAAALCAHSGAPIVPAAIVAPKGVGLFRPVKIVYGKPLSRQELGLHKADSTSLRSAIKRVEEEVRRLLEDNR